jgi:V/A-type H+-transporting ATPase subunit A
MKGKITGLSGPTVSVDSKGLKLYERVFVGHAMLTGEVVRIEKHRALIQVYEDTRGLAVGEPVHATGSPLTASLGPGLLSAIFDGLQRPLQQLRDETGPFILHGQNLHAFRPADKWIFHPLKKKGDAVSQGDVIGDVREGAFTHLISSGFSGRLSWISDGYLVRNEPVAALEDGTRIPGMQDWPVRIPRPCKRKIPPSHPLVTGQRCIDFLFPIIRGGTAIVPGGFGTGKTILEQSIAKYAEADIVVYVGCGERGNEMAELIEEFELLNDPWTNRKLMERTILVVNTSNMPVAAREASIYTAATIAEYFRDMGYDVLLLADSISRWAEALREISSSLEELPGEEGYPTYLASRLSSFMERAGIVETQNGKIGSLTMVLSVSPPGGDLTEPVTQSCMRSSGAFLMLDTSLAHRRHFPAINWLQSYSLYGGETLSHYRENISPEWENMQRQCREILRREESLREVAEIVGPEGLQDMDRLLMHAAEKIRLEFLCQNAYGDDAFSQPDRTVAAISGILMSYQRAAEKLKQGETLDEILYGGKK